jgi:hypothetical protein
MGQFPSYRHPQAFGSETAIDRPGKAQVTLKVSVEIDPRFNLEPYSNRSERRGVADDGLADKMIQLVPSSQLYKQQDVGDPIDPKSRI